MSEAINAVIPYSELLTARVLVFKRTHHGDPDRRGVFGCNGCMGRVRSWNYDAVIGIGGRRPWSNAKGIAAKVNWIGIRPHKTPRLSKTPLVTFYYFRDFIAEGDAPDVPPPLAERMMRVRAMMDGFNEEERAAIAELLEKAVGHRPLLARSIRVTCPPKNMGGCRRPRCRSLRR